MMVPKQPPPNLLAPYPAINARNQLGIINSLGRWSKNCAIQKCCAVRNAVLLLSLPCHQQKESMACGDG